MGFGDRRCFRLTVPSHFALDEEVESSDADDGANIEISDDDDETSDNDGETSDESFRST